MQSTTEGALALGFAKRVVNSIQKPIHPQREFVTRWGTGVSPVFKLRDLQLHYTDFRCIYESIFKYSSIIWIN